MNKKNNSISNSSNDSGRTYTYKTYQQLTFTDDYLFCRIMQSEPELCRQLIELLIDKPVAKVEQIESQWPVSINSDIKSVRFDVYLKDESGTVIDLEIQVSNKPELPRRSRYYQSVNDIDHLRRGMEYDQLPESYVIFICMFDPFEKGMPRYEFRELCKEDPRISLDDGTYKVFINAKSESPRISEEMRALFDYLCGKEPNSELTKAIDASIVKAKKERRWERDYVQFIEKLKEAEKAGIEIGLEQGLEQGVDIKARDTAAIMLAEGEPLDKIARYTGLSPDVIEAIAAE